MLALDAMYIHTAKHTHIHAYIQFVLILLTTFVSSIYYIMVFHAEYAMHITSGMGKCPNVMPILGSGALKS